MGEKIWISKSRERDDNIPLQTRLVLSNKIAMLLLSVNFCSRFLICSAFFLSVYIHYAAGVPWTSGRRVSKAMPTGFSSRLCNCDRFGERRARKGHQVDRFLAENSDTRVSSRPPCGWTVALPPSFTLSFLLVRMIRGLFLVFEYTIMIAGKVGSAVSYIKAHSALMAITLEISHHALLYPDWIDRFEPLAKWNSS